MSLFEENGRARIKYECAFTLDSNTEFGKSDRRRRRDLERRSHNQSRELRIKPLLRILINDRKRMRREPIYRQRAHQRQGRNQRNPTKIAQNPQLQKPAEELTRHTLKGFLTLNPNQF